MQLTHGYDVVSSPQPSLVCQAVWFDHLQALSGYQLRYLLPVVAFVHSNKYMNE